MLAALALASVVAVAAPEPVAVAPWQNLNDDAALRWLEQGAAETMAADLRRSGMRVVERAQIAQALAQVAAQAKGDVARAVAAGRIAGAKSIVLGSFQKSGAQIRLVARVVDVESGAVAEAAKATGPIDDIFRLQDRVVAALAKHPPHKRKRAPSVKAYEKLSLSLTATSDVDKRALLEQSLALDPGFVYARDALSALEKRMREAEDNSAPALDAREQQLLALVVDDKGDVARRTQAAAALLETLEGARHFHALLRAAEQVLAQKLPADVIDDVNERASAARVLALARLMRSDLALQAGERHLAAFPAGARRAQVDKLMREIIEVRRSEPARRKDYDDELKELAADKAAHEGPVDAGTRLSWDFKPCIAAKWSKLPAEMLAQCTRFLAAHGEDAGDDAHGHIVSARAYVAWAHAMRGELAEANALARALEAEIPGALDDSGLRSVMARWSAD